MIICKDDYDKILRKKRYKDTCDSQEKNCEKKELDDLRKILYMKSFADEWEVI